MNTNRVALTSRGKYGKTHVGLRIPKIEDLWDYLSYTGDGSTAKFQLVQKCCDVDLSQYPEGDVEHLFLTMRGMVKDYVIIGQFDCTKEECQDTVLYREDLRKLQSTVLPNDFERDFELVFPVCKKEKIINLITVEKRNLIEEYLDMYKTARDGELKFESIYKDETSGIGLDELVKYACMFQDSEDFDSIEKNIEFILGLDFTDFETLMLYDSMFSCGPQLHIACACDSCGKKYNVKIDTNSAFFGLDLNSLLRKHKFLAKASSITFADFKQYTVKEMENVAAMELNKK